MSQSVKRTVYITNYNSWDDFAERFRDGVNPVLEWRRSSRSMIGGATGDFAVIQTMHHDMADPFLVELQWCYRAARFICTNQVEILALPDLSQFAEHK